jgi:hypothetical protein
MEVTDKGAVLNVSMGNCRYKGARTTPELVSLLKGGIQDTTTLNNEIGDKTIELLTNVENAGLLSNLTTLQQYRVQILWRVRN